MMSYECGSGITPPSSTSQWRERSTDLGGDQWSGAIVPCQGVFRKMSKEPQGLSPVWQLLALICWWCCEGSLRSWLGKLYPPWEDPGMNSLGRNSIPSLTLSCRGKISWGLEMKRQTQPRTSSKALQEHFEWPGSMWPSSDYQGSIFRWEFKAKNLW